MSQPPTVQPAVIPPKEEPKPPDTPVVNVPTVAAAEKPAPFPIAERVKETATEFVDKLKEKVGLNAYTDKIEFFADMLGLMKSIEHQYSKANTEEKKRFFVFFVMGMALAYTSVFIALGNFGITLTAGQVAAVSFSFVLSLSTGFIMAKFKEIIPMYIDPVEQLKAIVNRISK